MCVLLLRRRVGWWSACLLCSLRGRALLPGLAGWLAARRLCSMCVGVDKGMREWLRYVLC